MHFFEGVMLAECTKNISGKKKNKKHKRIEEENEQFFLWMCNSWEVQCHFVDVWMRNALNASYFKHKCRALFFVYDLFIYVCRCALWDNVIMRCMCSIQKKINIELRRRVVFAKKKWKFNAREVRVELYTTEPDMRRV